MFKKAIEKTGGFTRPLHSIIRLYGGNRIIPGSATLFFINDDGYALTCRHVAELIRDADSRNTRYASFRNELKKIAKDGKFKKQLKGLELKYHYLPESIVQLRNNFVDCVEPLESLDFILHPQYDLAVIRFKGFTKKHYTGHAVFKKDTTLLQPGDFLCRLGFPFPEFTNFRYNETSDDIEWSTDGKIESPRFPIEGMLTRFMADGGKIFGIELSTPGLRGQSGGPLFDQEGYVYGVQFSTRHLHLGFDITETEFIVDNKPKKISDYSFLHLGQCIHADIIKDFLQKNNIRYYEE